MTRLSEAEGSSLYERPSIALRHFVYSFFSSNLLSLVSLVVCQLWSNSEVLLSLPYQREKWFSTDTVDSMINEMLLVKLDKNPSLDARDKAEARSELTSFILCHRKASYRFHNNTESTFSAIHSQCKLARAPEAHHCNGLPNVSSIVADSLKSSFYAARSNRPGMMPTEWTWNTSLTAQQARTARAAQQHDDDTLLRATA